MKILSQTSDHMVLKDTNYWGVFIAVLAILFGIFLSVTLTSAGSSLTNIIYWVGTVLVGFWAIFSTPTFIISINKTDGTILYHMKRIILSKIETDQISDVSRIEMRKAFKNTNKGTQAVTQSVIIFKDGREIPLEGKKTESAIGAGLIMGGDSRREDKEFSVAQQVATFINVPCQEISPDNNSSGIELPGGIRL